MWKGIFSSIVLCCFIVKLGDCKSTFIVTGSNIIPFKSTYTVAVASNGYDKSQNLQIKLYGKDGNKTVYEKTRNVVLKNSGLERVDFDLKDQVLGNYFLKIKNQTFEQATRLHLNTKAFSVFIQTDKAIYKPGEKVQFRVLVLNADTKPFATESVEVFITDGSNNRIKQFDKVFFRRGVFRQALQLSDEPVLGNWAIHVKVNGKDPETVQVFEVAEYVLPKFEVNVVTKSKIYKEEDIIVSYNAKYTYGKEVEGSAVVSAELMYYYWESPARTVEKSLDNTTKTTSISIKNDLNLQTIYWTQTVRVTVTFTEALTGIQRNATAMVDVYENLYNVQLINSDNNIKSNLPFTVKAFVKDLYEAPITDDKEPIVFTVTYIYEYPPETTTTQASTTSGLQTTTDGDLTTIPIIPHWWMFWRPPPSEVVTYKKYLKNGMSELSISIASNVTSISVSAEYKGANGYAYAGTRPTQNKQYLEIKVPEKLPMDRPSKLEITSNVRIGRVNYLVFARNRIVAKGQLRGSGSKSLKFNFQPTYSMTPSAKIIAFYVTSDGEIISGYKFLNFDSLLPNFVDIDLSKSEARPSSLLNISVKSKPLSYVGLLGVDQSVLLLKSGNDLSEEMITNEVFQFNYLDQYNQDWEEPTTYNYYTDFSAMDIFILTNANSQYEEIIRYRPDAFSAQGGGAPTTSTNIPSPVPISVIPENEPSGRAEIVTRKNFPETWMFECVDNTKGWKNITRKVPDTITSWIITGFSMNFQHGLGLTKEPTKLTVFMPFFISLNLPYSIKRGEIISIQAVIFNYMNDDVSATVTMSNDNQEFEFVEKTKNKKMLVKKIRSKANSGTSVKFIIRALKIGYITLKMEALTSLAGDRIEQKLLVEAEGITRYINEAILIDLRTQNKFSKSVDIVVPNDFVPDSLRIEASLIGDILGPTLDNLDKLIQMPSGCGEQNMLNFVPDIIVLDYLTNANRLTPDLETKLKTYMESGYQRELTYKRDDGSFSAFGNSDKAGSTWLTAFVARSFNQASKYITVDQNVISQALNFLQNVQTKDGSFTENGVVHHKAMQGGSASGTGLTSYVLLTFLENDKLTATYKKTINKAVDNIVMHVNEIDDVYTMSVVAYTLYLAGRTSTADMLLKKLNQQANNTDGTRHWEKKTSDLYLTSLSIETSAYALLAYLQALKDADAMLIAKWLVSQRNSNGGFQSTQDTVVGLLALSKIAARISTKTLSIKIDLSYQNNVKSLSIDQKNALVLQQVELPSTIRNIKITAAGSGFTVVQISYHYNIKEPKKTNNFVLNAKVSSSADYYFTLETCVGLKNMDQSNMAVMEISTPSGYIFDSDSLNSIVGSSSNIKRVEPKNGNTLANIYFDYLQAKVQCISVNATKSFDVADQKPIPIVVYDYYANDLRAEIFYTPAKVILCDICDPSDCLDVCK